MPSSSTSNNNLYVGFILTESLADENIASWIKTEILERNLKPPLTDILYSSVPYISDTNKYDPADFASVAMEEMDMYLLRAYTDALRTTKNVPVQIIFLMITVFWDGQSEEGKNAFLQLKQIADPKNPKNLNWQKKCAEKFKSLGFSEDANPPTIEILLQALNAKSGNHNLKDNQAALIATLKKKMGYEGVTAASSTEKHADPCAMAPPSGFPVSRKEENNMTKANASIGEDDLSVEHLEKLIEKGQGECFLVIAAEDTTKLEALQKELTENCQKIQVEVSPVTPDVREVSSNGNACVAIEYLLRRALEGQHMELRLAMCGNVDSGKSTLTAVLTRGCRDDGRGFARTFVFNHKHEAITGRTSSISENHLGFSSTGEVVNYKLEEKMSSWKKNNNNNDSSETQDSKLPKPKQFTTQELASNSAKVFTLYDLAGHEKYLKTTVLGMTRTMPDYACVVISANNGIQRMTKEHIALCLALKLPFFVVVTRIDATPENIRRETVTNINKLLRIPTVRKLPYPIRKLDDVILCAKNLRHDRITPIFEISNVTGDGLADLIRFLNLLPIRKDWVKAKTLPKEMIIDSTFFVTGVGTVVGGIVTQGVFRVNDTVLLGPDGFGQYRNTNIKSIHVKGVDSSSAEAGTDAAFCLKKEKRSAIRKGHILVDPHNPPKSYWQFEAEVTILYHSTTISVNYEPVIHSSTVRQSARITYVAQEILRTGDRSIVHFHFLYRPEFMKEDQRLIFREGRTKGIGIVTKLIEGANDELLAKSKAQKKLLYKKSLTSENRINVDSSRK